MVLPFELCIIIYLVWVSKSPINYEKYKVLLL